VDINWDEMQEIAFIDLGEHWEYEVISVIQDPRTGKYFAGHDSGCSCTYPFEDMQQLSDWTEIRTKAEAVDFAKRHSSREFRADETAKFMGQLQQNWVD